MAESSTCLLRSFSTPIDTSCASNEGDPVRALGESISFGRFMSESLDWEKWSAFTQNRYVEEAEKYSKPGSVAAKKAFFEAHYKRKAAEKATALVEEENAQTNQGFDSVTKEGNCIDSSAQIKSEHDNIETANEEINKDKVDYRVVNCDDTNQCKCDVGQNDLEIKSEADNIEITNEEINKDSVDYQVVDCDYTNQYECDVGQCDLDIFEVEGTNEVVHPCNDLNLNVESCMLVDNSIQLEHVEVLQNIVVPFEETAPDPVDCEDTIQYECDVVKCDLDIFEVEGPYEVVHPCNDLNLNVESCMLVDNSIQLDHVEVLKNIVMPSVETVPDPVDCAHTTQYECDVGQCDLDIFEVQGTDEVVRPCNDLNLNVESCMLVDNSIQLDHAEVLKNIVISFEETAPDPGITDQEVLAFPVKGRKVNSSPKSSAKTRSEILPCSPDVMKASAAVSPRIGIKSGSKCENFIGEAVEKKKLTARSLRMPINLPSGTGERSKTADATLRSRNGINRFSATKKSVGSLVEKKRLTASSLHMSINVPSRIGVASKITTTTVKPKTGINIVPKSIKPIGTSMEKRPTGRSLHMSINLSSGAGGTSRTGLVIEDNRNKKIHCDLPKVHPEEPHASTLASHGLLNQAPANLPSQRKRTERLVSKSVSGVDTLYAKLSSVSVNCLKSSSTTKSNIRPLTKLSPFRFRSEERAIKRKELLQRMDEIKSMEEEKVQLQRISKDKTEHVHKKLQQSSVSKSKPNDDMPSGAQPTSNQIKKISVALPRSPKPVRKASSSTIKNMGNSWKPPISTGNSKLTTEKNNQTRQSGTSLSNTRRENASPNIQH